MSTHQAALRALAEPHRQEMLQLVSHKPRSVGEIATHFDITQQAVSQHLQVLKQAGLVSVTRQGQRRLYVVHPDGLEAIHDFLAQLWPAGLERLKRAVEEDDAR
jgi:DNA-binding transcriptional ArsR family regulator